MRRGGCLGRRIREAGGLGVSLLPMNGSCGTGEGCRWATGPTALWGCFPHFSDGRNDGIFLTGKL